MSSLHRFNCKAKISQPRRHQDVACISILWTGISAAYFSGTHDIPPPRCRVSLQAILNPLLQEVWPLAQCVARLSTQEYFVTWTGINIKGRSKPTCAFDSRFDLSCYMCVQLRYLHVRINFALSTVVKRSPPKAPLLARSEHPPS